MKDKTTWIRKFKKSKSAQCISFQHFTFNLVLTFKVSGVPYGMYTVGSYSTNHQGNENQNHNYAATMENSMEVP